GVRARVIRSIRPHQSEMPVRPGPIVMLWLSRWSRRLAVADRPQPAMPTVIWGLLGTLAKETFEPAPRGDGQHVRETSLKATHPPAPCWKADGSSMILVAMFSMVSAVGGPLGQTASGRATCSGR